MFGVETRLRAAHSWLAQKNLPVSMHTCSVCVCAYVYTHAKHAPYSALSSGPGGSDTHRKLSRRLFSKAGKCRGVASAEPSRRLREHHTSEARQEDTCNFIHILFEHLPLLKSHPKWKWCTRDPPNRPCPAVWGTGGDDAQGPFTCREAPVPPQGSSAGQGPRPAAGNSPPSGRPRQPSGLWFSDGCPTVASVVAGGAVLFRQDWAPHQEGPTSLSRSTSFVCRLTSKGGSLLRLRLSPVVPGTLARTRCVSRYGVRCPGAASTRRCV